MATISARCGRRPGRILFCTKPNSAMTGTENFEAGVAMLAPQVPVLGNARAQGPSPLPATNGRSRGEPVATVVDTTGAETCSPRLPAGHVRARPLPSASRWGGGRRGRDQPLCARRRRTCRRWSQPDRLTAAPDDVESGALPASTLQSALRSRSIRASRCHGGRKPLGKSSASTARRPGPGHRRRSLPARHVEHAAPLGHEPTLGIARVPAWNTSPGPWRAPSPSIVPPLAGVPG